MKQLKSYTNIKPSLDEDDDEVQGNSNLQHIHLPYYESTQVARKIKFYLDEQIREPKYYRNILNIMDTLGEGDVVEIVVNTYGGSFDSAVAIINAMRNTEANCQVRIEGMAASAGSLIALAADNLFVMPSATLMLHQGVFGSYGKQTNVVQHAVFEDQRVQDLARQVYANFLTDKELDDLFTGKDFWMHYDEIVERLEKRHEIQLKQIKEEERLEKLQQKKLLSGSTEGKVVKKKVKPLPEPEI